MIKKKEKIIRYNIKTKAILKIIEDYKLNESPNWIKWEILKSYEINLLKNYNEDDSDLIINSLYKETNYSLDSKNLKFSKENDVINICKEEEALIWDKERDEIIEENYQILNNENKSNEELEESDNMISFFDDENDEFDEKNIYYNLKDLYDDIE